MTHRLISLADQHWARFDGWAASRGLDPLELPIDRYLNLVYSWAVESMDQENLDKFDEQLWRPPKGEVVEQGPWSAEAETSAFQAFQADFAAGGVEQ